MMNKSKYFFNTFFIKFMKVVEAFVSQKDITTNSYPEGCLRDVTISNSKLMIDGS